LWISFSLLRSDPARDPLRDHPRFKKPLTRQRCEFRGMGTSAHEFQGHSGPVFADEMAVILMGKMPMPL
jgi:hypothetical protein